MSYKDIIHIEKYLSDLMKNIRQELNKKIDEIEKYHKLIMKYHIENELNNSATSNLNSLEKIIDLQNRITFMKHTS